MTNSFIEVKSLAEVNAIVTKEEAALVRGALDVLVAHNGCSRFHVKVLADSMGVTKILKGCAHIYGINEKVKTEFFVDLDFRKDKKACEVAVATPRVENIAWMKDNYINEKYQFVYSLASEAKVLARRVGRIQLWNRVR